ncbi:MAG: response regulator [Pseudomonadales bacterium]|nr:response regulator [Pseudomonadales bacterium]
MLRLMIVDDSNIIRKQIERLHGNSLFKVVASAANGEQAVAAWHEHKPDVVTMDITMPEMDGLQATKALLEKDPYIRILIVSALSDKETAIEALELGARGFLCKPFADDELKSALEKVIME